MEILTAIGIFFVLIILPAAAWKTYKQTKFERDFRAWQQTDEGKAERAEIERIAQAVNETIIAENKAINPLLKQVDPREPKTRRPKRPGMNAWKWAALVVGLALPVYLTAIAVWDYGGQQQAEVTAEGEAIFSGLTPQAQQQAMDVKDEPCIWTARKAIELRDLKTQSGFPEFALVRLGAGFVELEREDGFVKKAKLVGVLEGFAELLFDPEMKMLIDGSLSEEELYDIFYAACKEAM